MSLYIFFVNSKTFGLRFIVEETRSFFGKEKVRAFGERGQWKWSDLLCVGRKIKKSRDRERERHYQTKKKTGKKII